MGPVSICAKSNYWGTGDAAEHLKSQRELFMFIILLHLLLVLLLSTFSASAVGIIRQIRLYIQRYLRTQKRASHQS